MLPPPATKEARKKRTKGGRSRGSNRGSPRSDSASLDVEGTVVPVSHLDKVLYPEAGFNKADVIDYYIRIAPCLLPHLKDRPLTLKRYPNGVQGGFFYEKKCPAFRPEWVQTAPVWTEKYGADIQYCLVNDLPTLVWAANLGDLEMHTFLSRAANVDRPTMIVFDLDPGPPAGILECLKTAFWLKEKLEKAGLQTFLKTSGSKGLQVYIPLNTPVTYDSTKTFAHSLAQQLEHEHPDLILSLMEKRLRAGKVFVDWSQNDRHKTTVCVYSLRAKEKPTVSTPLEWKEASDALKKKNAARLVFLPEQVLQRVEEKGDLFEPVLRLKQKPPAR